jgi:hypothetical protein
MYRFRPVNLSIPLKRSINDIKNTEGLWHRFMPMGGQGLKQLQKFMGGMSKNDEGGD